MSEPLKAIVMAAGKGTRLRTEGVDLPKVLRQAAGAPLLAHVLSQLDFLPPEDIVLVVGYEGDKVVSAFPGYPHAFQSPSKSFSVPSAHWTAWPVPSWGDWKAWG